MQASRVTRPSRSGNPPYPTEELVGSASGTWTPFSTASSALPLFFNISQAAAFAAIPKSQVEITMGEFRTGLSLTKFEKDLFTATIDAPVSEVAARNLRRLIINKYTKKDHSLE
jgi:hypothetical protein